MKRIIILATAVAALLSSCKQKRETTASTEKYEGSLWTKGTLRGETDRYFITPPDTLIPFVDELVNDVYSGKLQAYYPLHSDTATERAIALEDLDKLGKDTQVLGKDTVITDYFKPSDASFVSFKQKYFHDTIAHKIRTEVTEVSISRDLKTTKGTLLGAEPVFYIKLK